MCSIEETFNDCESQLKVPDFAHLAGLVNLEVLDLAHEKIRWGLMKVLCENGHEKLHTLNVTDTATFDVDMDHCLFPNLTDLSIGLNHVTDHGLNKINCPKLRILCATCNLTADGVFALLEKYPRLERLEVLELELDDMQRKRLQSFETIIYFEYRYGHPLCKWKTKRDKEQSLDY